MRGIVKRLVTDGELGEEREDEVDRRDACRAKKALCVALQ